MILSLYSVLNSTFNNPKEVSKMTPAGTPVKMLAPDGRIIIEGIVALDQPSVFNGVNVSATRVVMTVEKVHVPAYLIGPTLLLSRQPTPLSAFGSVPFNLLCQANHLRTSANVDSSTGSDSESNNSINPAMLTVISPQAVMPAVPLSALEGPLSEVAESNLNEPSPIDIWTESDNASHGVVVTDELEPMTKNIASSHRSSCF